MAALRARAGLALLGALAALGAPGAGAWAQAPGSKGPRLPDGILTVDSLMKEVRGPLSLKLNEMKQNFRIEAAGSEVRFLGSGDHEMARSVFEAVRESDTETLYRVRLSRDGRDLFEETIATWGTDLKKPSPSQRVFLEDTDRVTYSLGPGENRKLVVLSLDRQEFMRFQSLRMPGGPALNDEMILTEVTLGTSKVLRFVDATDREGVRRLYQIHMGDDSFSIAAFGWEIGRGFRTHTYDVEVRKGRDDVVESPRYYIDQQEVYGLNVFVEDVAGRLYRYIVQQGAANLVGRVISRRFPATRAQKNLAASSRLLEELQVLRRQTDDAKTNPNILNVMSSKLSALIEAVQSGQITDQRPKP